MTEQVATFSRPGLSALLVLLLVPACGSQPAPGQGAAQSASPPAAAPTVAAAAASEPAGPNADPDVAQAEEAALAWLALVDAGKFDETWDEASTLFQKGQKREDWSKGLGGARPAMGKLVSRTLHNHEVRSELPNLPPDKYVTVRFVSAFENHKDGAESVTLVKDGDRGFRMVSYLLR